MFKDGQRRMEAAIRGNPAVRMFLNEQWDYFRRHVEEALGILRLVRAGDLTPAQIERLDRLAQTTSAWLAMLNDQGRVFSPPVDEAQIAQAMWNTLHGSIAPLSETLELLGPLRQGGLTSTQADHLDRFETANKHLLGALKDWLGESQNEDLRLKEAPIRMEPLANRVLSRFRDQAEGKGLRLSLEMSPSLPPDVLGDEVRIEQALVNYMSNAVKFTKRGSITVRVRPLEQAPGNVLLRFEVADTGIGVAPDELSRLFGVFEQAVKPSAHFYGLGLLITQRLAQMMGGDAGADSTPAAHLRR